MPDRHLKGTNKLEINLSLWVLGAVLRTELRWNRSKEQWPSMPSSLTVGAVRKQSQQCLCFPAWGFCSFSSSGGLASQETHSQSVIENICCIVLSKDALFGWGLSENSWERKPPTEASQLHVNNFWF